MLVHTQKINSFKICDLITDPKSLNSLLSQQQQWHRFHCVTVYNDGKYADSLCQIRQQILKFSPTRNLMICLKRDQITCFEGMLFHSKMTYIRMTRQCSKKRNFRSLFSRHNVSSVTEMSMASTRLFCCSNFPFC